MSERLTRRELLSKPRLPEHQDRVLTGHVTSGIGHIIMVRTDQPLDELVPAGTPLTITLHEPIRQSVVLADETTALLAATRISTTANHDAASD